MVRNGLRALIVVPATNTTMEPEMTALCPDMAPFAVARVVRGGGTFRPEELANYTQATLDALAPYLDDPPDIVFHGCTAAGFLAGLQGNARVVAAIEARIDAAVVSTAQSMADVLLAHGLTRISVLTPYVESLNQGLRAFLSDYGIDVSRLDSFDCRTTAEMLALTEEQVFARAVDCVAPGSQGLFLACTQMPTLGIIPRLEDRLGIPVWSAISASAWNGERARLAMA
jgi:maleate cis-trans isomerase